MSAETEGAALIHMNKVEAGPGATTRIAEIQLWNPAQLTTTVLNAGTKGLGSRDAETEVAATRRKTTLRGVSSRTQDRILMTLAAPLTIASNADSLESLKVNAINVVAAGVLWKNHLLSLGASDKTATTHLWTSALHKTSALIVVTMELIKGSANAKAAAGVHLKRDQGVPGVSLGTMMSEPAVTPVNVESSAVT